MPAVVLALGAEIEIPLSAAASSVGAGDAIETARSSGLTDAPAAAASGVNVPWLRYGISDAASSDAAAVSGAAIDTARSSGLTDAAGADAIDTARSSGLTDAPPPQPPASTCHG